MLLKLSIINSNEYYNFKTLNAIPVVTPKKMVTEYPQKEMRKQ